MKLHYYPETDSLYIELSTAPSVETRPITDQVTSTSTLTAALLASTSTTPPRTSTSPPSKPPTSRFGH